MNATIRDLRFVQTAVLQDLHDVASTALASWAEKWMACAVPDAMSELLVNAVEPGDASMTGPASHLTGGHGELWFDESNDNDRRFGLAVAGSALLDGATGVDQWVTTALANAKAERNRVLGAALTGASPRTQRPQSVTQLPRELFALGSGAVRIRCLGIGLDVVADAEAASRARVSPRARSPSPSRLPRLMPLEGVAASTHAQLVASLDSPDLDISTVVDLRPGDVLRLPRRLDEGIDISCAGVRVSRAQLGELGGRKGIQLRSSQHFKD